MRAEPLEPRRIRQPRGAYGWVDLRFVTEGHLQALDPGAALTYLFLCTVGNREGISFWSRPRMARLLNLPEETIEIAMRTLSAADLIVASDRVIQVLPLPTRVADQAMASHKNAMTLPPANSPIQTCPDNHADVTEDEIHAQEPKARAIIARFYGNREPKMSVVRGLARSLALKERDGCW